MHPLLVVGVAACTLQACCRMLAQHVDFQAEGWVGCADRDGLPQAGACASTTLVLKGPSLACRASSQEIHSVCKAPSCRCSPSLLCCSRTSFFQP